MDFDYLNGKTLATMDEIRVRVGRALACHPLCRDVRFDIISVPRTVRGNNWTVCLQADEAGAVREASEIVVEIQEVYDLAGEF